MNTLLSIPETKRLIESGAALAVAGSARALSALPRGNWIGGTSHYFIGSDGAVKSDDRVFVTDLGAFGPVQLAVYGPNRIEQLTTEAPEHGFSVVVIPAASESLRRFAQRPYTSDLFLKAVVGWVAGVDLAELRTAHAQVVDGRSGKFETDAVVAAHVKLPPDKMPAISIVNPFHAAATDILQFEEPAFSATHALINGSRTALADFLAKKGYAHGRLPLIGDYSGAAVNVSIQAVESASGRVDFYAPVFPGISYRLAEPVADYAKAFREALQGRETPHIALSCNCILNYLYGELEGKRLGNTLGPVTFGEIAYQLLNQTMVILEIV